MNDAQHHVVIYGQLMTNCANLVSIWVLRVRACPCARNTCEDGGGWWWEEKMFWAIVVSCSTATLKITESKKHNSQPACVCVWAMWIRFKKNILAHDNVFGPIQKTEEWFKISNLNPANLPLTFCGMGKCSGKRSALKYAKAHTASVSSMDEPQKGHREAKRRFIMAGLRMLKAPAVLWPH